jgi:transcriptional regulator with XRE-family HTH domain
MAADRKRIEYDEVVRRFGGRLRQARAGRGMTQADLADRAGVSEAYVGRLERGRAAPGIDLVARLAKALGLPAADLLPDGPSSDGPAVLRDQARRLFDRVVGTDDEATLSLLAQILAKLAESAPPGR